MNASALNTASCSTRRHSASPRTGQQQDLGHYVCHHNYRTSANGKIDGFEDQYWFGRNPPGRVILVNFRNLGKQDTDFVGGYTTFAGAYRSQAEPTDRVGAAYKDALSKPGPWGIYMYMQGETIPKESNHVRLHETEKDQWGIPLLVTSVKYDETTTRR